MKLDVIYEHLVEMADATGFIPKKEISYVGIGKKLNMSRQTVSTHFNTLIEQNKLEKTSDGYIIKGYENAIPVESGKIVRCVLNEDAKKVYFYLRKQGRIKFTMAELVKKFGIEKDIMLIILVGLQRLGLIKIHADQYLDEYAGRFRYVYYIDNV